MNSVGGNNPIGNTQSGQNTNPVQDVATKRFSGFKVSFLAGVGKLLGLHSSKVKGKPIGSRKIESVPVRQSLSTKGAQSSSSGKLSNEILNNLKNDPAIKNSFSWVNATFEKMKTAKKDFAAVRNTMDRGNTEREGAKMELQIAKNQFKKAVNEFNKLSGQQPQLLDAGDLETVAMNQNALADKKPGDDLSADEQRAEFHLNSLKIALLSRSNVGTDRSPRG